MKKLPLLALLIIPAVLCWNVQAGMSESAGAWVVRLGVVAFVFVGMFGLVLVVGTNMGEPAGGLDLFMDIGLPTRVEPERGRGGSVIVYRWHDVWENDGKYTIIGARGGDWSKWQLTSNGVPDMDNQYGVYGYHNPNDPGLENYRTSSGILVKVELRGQKVIHKRGSRGQVGTVVDVLKAEKDVPEKFVQSLRKGGCRI